MGPQAVWKSLQGPQKGKVFLTSQEAYRDLTN